MKLSPRTVTLFWDVHTWAGVLTSLVLAAMFFAGSLSLFHHEIEVWQDPPTAPADVASLDVAFARTDQDALVGKPVAAAPPSSHSSRSVLYLPDREPLVIDPATGAVHATRSMVGQLFFHLHFFWHESFPTGMVIAGLFGVLLLLALVTGLVIHLKDLRRQAFRFRPWLRPRYVWSDLHKILGVWGLPFQTMIAFTGAVVCLAPILIPPIAGAAFDGDRARGERELYGTQPGAAKEDAPAAMMPFAELTRLAEIALPGIQPTYVAIDRWGKAGARATVWGDLPGDRFHPGVHVVLDAHDGALIARSVDVATPAMTAIYVVYGVHFASYGGLGLKLLYFLLGIGGWLTILSGNWIWLERRAARRASRGNVILGRLTLGAGGGILVATSVILWINRLAAPTAARPGLEVWGFFATWALVTVVALALPAYRRSWAVLLGIAGVGIALVPILSALLSPAHLGNGGGLPGWHAAGVDAGAGIIGILLLLAARAAWRHGAPAVATPDAVEDEP